MLGRLRLRAMRGQSRGGADASPRGDLNGSRRKFVCSSALDLNNQEAGDQYSAQINTQLANLSAVVVNGPFGLLSCGCCG